MTERAAQDVERVVEMFLDLVDREAVIAGLGGDARLALCTRLSEQINAGVRAAREGEEVTAALAIIDALGAPSAIVRAAGGRPMWSPGAQAAASSASTTFEQLRDRGAVEAIACLLIVLHPLVPAGGLLACLVCLLISQRWSTGEKLLGVFGAVFFGFAAIGLMAQYVLLDTSFLPVALLGVVIPIWIAVHLWRRAGIRV